jgi:hypothetical protein
LVESCVFISSCFIRGFVDRHMLENRLQIVFEDFSCLTFPEIREELKVASRAFYFLKSI